MIGNDIIDLRKAKSDSNWERKGFLEKLFADQEQESILKAENSFEMVWKFWSMKEAAYKAFVQPDRKRFFAPKKFMCQTNALQKGTVCFENDIFFTVSFANKDRIFTIASKREGAEIHSKVVSPTEIQSSIKKFLARKTGVPFMEINQRKSVNGIPNYYHENSRLTRSCSISHHGNYGAFSILCD